MLSRFNCVWLFATPWTVAHQAPLSIGFSRQEYWSGLPCPPPVNLPWPRDQTHISCGSYLAGRFFTAEPPGKRITLGEPLERRKWCFLIQRKKKCKTSQLSTTRHRLAVPALDSRSILYLHVLENGDPLVVALWHMQVARQNYIFQHPSPCFQLGCAAGELSLQDWRWTRLGVELSLSGGSGWADDYYTFPRSSCSFSHSWATRVFCCMTDATSELPLQVTHFVRLEEVRTGRSSSPCMGSGSSSLTFYPPSLPHHLPFALPALRPDKKTTFQRPFNQMPLLEQGQGPVMNSTQRLDRQMGGLYTPSGSASLNESS